MWKRAHGLQRPSEQAIRKAGATDATLVAKTHLEAERILGAVISGMGRMLALCACIAGTGSAGRAGTSSAAIKIRSSGVNFRRKEGIAPDTTGTIKRTYGARGNLRNGSNAGSVYVNCRNRLDRANWNYLG